MKRMFRTASDQSIYLDRSPDTLDLEALLAIPGVVNVHPGYRSVLLVFDPMATEANRVAEEAAGVAGKPNPRPPTRHEIPVAYDGPDLEAVARHAGMAPEQVVAIHTGAIYNVAFLGFVPGFAYLRGLPPAIHAPRLSTPRPHVPAGSVGIAGGQTGVYPMETPGGWLLIGRTEIAMFRPDRSPMSLLRPGDEVRFRAV